MIFDEVALLSLPVALLRHVRDLDLGDVRRVVEVDDVNVKHQHGRTGDLRAWGGQGEGMTKDRIKSCGRTSWETVLRVRMANPCPPLRRRDAGGL